MDYDKRRQTLLEKYGGEEGLKQHYRDLQKKSRINYDDSKRQATLGAEKRSEIARKAAQARWQNKRSPN